MAWRADIQFAADQLPRLHPNFFTRGSRDDFATLVEQSLIRIGTQSEAANMLDLTRIFAFGADGHTTFNPFQAGSTLTRFPLTLRWFDDGLWVLSIAESQAKWLGRRLLSLQDVDVEEAHRRLLPWISHENDSWARLGSAALLTCPEALQAVGLLNPGEPLRLNLEGDSAVELPAANQTQVSGPQLARPRNPLYMRYGGFNYWFDYLAQDRALYVQYNRCAETASLPMIEFTRQLFDFFAGNDVQRAIFDLRANGGGNSAVLNPILDAIDEGRRLGQRLPMACIIGRRTYSSGVFNAIDLKQRGAGLVGEPTGGNPSWFGEVRTIPLPSTPFTGSYSTRKFNIPGFPGPNVAPDLPAGFFAREYFEDRDPWLDAALKYTERL